MGRRRDILGPTRIENIPTLVSTSSPATNPIDGDGRARGCRAPNSFKIAVPGVYEREVGGVIPSWVQATPSPGAAPDPSPRLVEGTLEESRITSEDFPLKPWHTYYDWNLFVRVDPQYTNLLSIANTPGILECEWDSAFFPSWAWPQRHQRIWMMGRWIYDCGHEDENGNCRTEIHPPKAVVSFRSEAVTFSGAKGPVRATQAVVYIGREGGYWRSPINDQDYDFRIPLPPRPSLRARPVFKFESKTGRLPVEPIITNLGQGLAPPVGGVIARPQPGGAPGLGGFAPAAAVAVPPAANVVAANAVATQPTVPSLNFPFFTDTALDVRIPLKGLNPHPDEYGVIISAGWTDPTGTETKQIVPLNVKVEKIFMDSNLDPASGDEWYVYVGVNGRWKVFESIGGASKSLNHSVNLDLHPLDKISITVCGFEADELHDLMGRGTTVSKSQVSERGTNAEATQVAKAIRNKFLADLASVGGGIIGGGIIGGIAGLAGANWDVENEAISTLFIQEAVTTHKKTVIKRTDAKDYRLQYTISPR